MLPELSDNDARARIARRVAADLKDGLVVNLGIGMPQLVLLFVPDGVRLILQTENGVINAGPPSGKDDLRVIDAGGAPISVLPGGAFVSSALSFAIMRGGHVDATVLGALEVDSEGSLANWMIPGVSVPGMGGGMDIAVGAKKVYVATKHFKKNGAPKLVEKCTLPLTARRIVDAVMTEYCTVERVNGKMTLVEIYEGVPLEELIAKTGMRLDISPKLKTIKG